MRPRSKWLSEYDPAFLANGRKTWYRSLGHTPKLGQQLFDEAVDSGKRFVSLFTPNQDGKSYHIAKAVGAYLLLPEIHIWLVGPTYKDASKEFFYLETDLIAMGVKKQARTWHRNILGDMRIELKNGSWVEVISTENPENLRREQLDVVVLCEASKLPADLYQRMLYSRVERRRGKCLVPTTHKGYGWVWDAFALPSMPVLPRSFTWGPWEGNRRVPLGGTPNPAYDSEYWSCQVSYVEDYGEVLHTGEYLPEVIAKARVRLPPPMFAEQFGGEAASYAGLVYPFDPTRHECEPFDIPRDWTHVVGYDHGAGGGSDPTAILLGSYAPDGTLYFWREIYDTESRAVSARAGMLKMALDGREATIMRGRDAKQIGKELSEAGLPSGYPHEADIGARLIRMTSLMQENRWKLLRGRCPNLKRELLAYEWDEARVGKPKDGNDHALEAAGMASLAPVSLPDVSTGLAPMSEDAASLADRILRDRLWGEWKKDRKAEQEARSGALVDDLFDPDPLIEDQSLVESYEP